MKIWIDADACPNVIKEILYRVAKRAKVTITFVANQYIKTPASPFLKSLQVPGGFDVADDEIVRQLDKGDLVITADIPLADEVIEKGGYALSPRGELLTKENIKPRLQVRDMMEAVRNSAVDISGGQAAFGQKDKQSFANALDRFVARHHKSES
ncbi:MAG: YaiI/YqxD family protein [Gammaproteobacteria bacterium]|nr:YaiI/YqxD family protein [Gammaproteobacteria bacterium]